MKKITIINGLDGNDGQTFKDNLTQIFATNDDRASFESFDLRNIRINYCCGCWNCWFKTPGKCIHEDEMPQLLRGIIHSDLTLFISPIKMGFVSSDVKKITDKLIPLVLPYIEIVKGECHHVKRYDKYPKLGLILVDKERNQEGYRIITNIYQRFAINLRTELAFSILSDGRMEEITDAINYF